MYTIDRDLSSARELPFADLMADLNAWKSWSPRAEVEPDFRVAAYEGPQDRPALVLSGNGRPEACGCWRLPLPGLTVGRRYMVEVLFAAESLPDPGKSVYAMLTAPSGKPGLGRDFYDHLDYRGEKAGWHTMSVPFAVEGPPADLALELFLGWATRGSVRWADARLYDVTDLEPQTHNVHMVALSGDPEAPESPAACVAFYTDRMASLGNADLICLPELINVAGLGLSWEELSEPIPGPTSLNLAEAARSAGSYVAASLLEREGGAIYNTGILLDRSGGLVGKYRKTHLPPNEGFLWGVTPGDEYPVFETDFGRVGYMICYDGHYPEVSRMLALAGAEVLLLSNNGDGREGGSLWEPFIRTRALDNQVHILAAVNSGRSCVVSPRGEVLAMSDRSPGSVAAATCDLAASATNYTGRPIRRRYDQMRRSNTFHPLCRHLWDA